FPGCERGARELAAGRDRVHIDDEVFDVAVAIFLHPARIGGNPATQGGELDAVRLMAERVAVCGEAALEMTADGAGLDARHPIRAIDPEDAVEPSQIDAHDRA